VNRITKTERDHLLAAAKLAVNLDDAGEIVGGFTAIWQEFMAEHNISDQRARRLVSQAARIKRGYMVRQPGRPVSLDTAAGPFTVYLSPADVQLASIIGQGNVSAGVRLALEDARQRLAAKERNDKISKKLQVALS
jgi:hypothetical protein